MSPAQVTAYAKALGQHPGVGPRGPCGGLGSDPEGGGSLNGWLWIRLTWVLTGPLWWLRGEQLVRGRTGAGGRAETTLRFQVVRDGAGPGQVRGVSELGAEGDTRVRRWE